MNRSFILTGILILVGMLAIWILSCGSDSSSPDDGTVDPDWPENSLDLPEADAAALDSLTSRLTQLMGTLDPVTARHALVDEYADGVGVIEWARLTSDSTTISIKLTDGVTTAIFADDIFGRTDVDVTGVGMIPPGDGERNPRLRKSADKIVKRLRRALDSGDIVMPESHRVSLVNMAGGSDQGTHDAMTDIKNAFIFYGWDDSLITINSRLNREDKSFVPDDMFDQQGYGIVMFFGHGGFTLDQEGAEHFKIQCFLGGKRETGYEEYVTEERWQDYKQWYHTDRSLMTGYSYISGGPEILKEIYMRDDLLMQEINLDPGALVAFISCNSKALFDEMATAGAGAVMGWEGQTDLYIGPLNFINLIGFMAANESRTDVEALEALYNAGMGTGLGSYGNITYYRAADITGDFYIPGWGTVSAPADNFPSAAYEADVTISYEDYPEAELNFTLAIGDESEVDGLIPGTAQVSVTARNNTGDIIGAGRNSVQAKSGVNEIEVETCDAELTIATGEYPRETDGYVSNIEYILTYNDIESDPITGGFDPGGPPTINDLMPLPATLTTAALDGSTIIGTSTDSIDLYCDENDLEICYGWLTLSAGDLIEGIENITVTIDSGGTYAPDSVMFSASAEQNVFGFKTGETVMLTAEGFDVHGVSQGIVSMLVDIECGANEVVINITSYMIMLEADPIKLPHDGSTASTITATLLSWEEGDINEPTGDPVVGKPVEFDASCGTFVGASSGTSDANGQVSVQLVSDAACVAEVHAFVTEDLAESMPVYINFEQKLSFWINGNPDDVTGPTTQGYFYATCTMVDFYFNGQFIQNHECGEAGGWGLYNPGWAIVGNVIKLDFSPFTEDDYCTDGPSTIEPVYLHTAYENDFVHQKTYLMTAGTDNLVDTLSVSVELEEIDYYR